MTRLKAIALTVLLAAFASVASAQDPIRLGDSSVLFGTVAPENAQGASEGKFYVDTVAKKLYIKKEGGDSSRGWQLLLDASGSGGGGGTWGSITGTLSGQTDLQSALDAKTTLAAVDAQKLSVFAATTSAELAGVVSDETGSGGGFVRATSPTLVTPALGAASATTLNIAAGNFNAPSLYLGGTTNTGWYENSPGQWTWTQNSGPQISFISGQIRAQSALVINWSSGGNSTTAGDVGLARAGAGLLEVNNATSGALRDITYRHFIAGGTAPGVADTTTDSCGSGLQTIDGKDALGKVTVIGSSGTSCTVTFGTAFTIAPVCTAGVVGSGNAWLPPTTTTTMTLAGTFAQNAAIGYRCDGY